MIIEKRNKDKCAWATCGYTHICEKVFRGKFQVIFLDRC